MKVFNITDVETPTLRTAERINLPVAVGGKVLKPGASADVPALTLDDQRWIQLGVLSLEPLPAGYEKAHAAAEHEKEGAANRARAQKQREDRDAAAEAEDRKRVTAAKAKPPPAPAPPPVVVEPEPEPEPVVPEREDETRPIDLDYGDTRETPKVGKSTKKKKKGK